MSTKIIEINSYGAILYESCNQKKWIWHRRRPQYIAICVFDPPLQLPLASTLQLFNSDSHGVKYFWEALDLKYNFSYSWGVPLPPNPLPPQTSIAV